MLSKIDVLETHNRTIPFLILSAIVLAGGLILISRLARGPFPPRNAKPQDADIHLVGVRRYTDERADNPNILELTIETDRTLQPVAFVAQFDGEIGMGSAVIRSNGTYLHYAKVKQGIPAGHLNWFAFEWDKPALSPDSSLILTVYSRQPVHLARLDHVAYEWP